MAGSRPGRHVSSACSARAASSTTRFVAEVDAEGEAIAARMRDFLFGAPAGDPREMFDHVYATPTPLLEAERAMLQQELTAAEETT